MRRTRGGRAPGFKAKEIKGDKTLPELAEHFDVHPNQISEWKQQLQESAADVFGGSPKVKVTEPDLKVLHAKIGQLTLENDFLESALAKAGLPAIFNTDQGCQFTSLEYHYISSQTMGGAMGKKPICPESPCRTMNAGGEGGIRTHGDA